jgi:hypothetical protein
VTALHLALVITGDANGAKKALSETRAEMGTIPQAANTAGNAFDTIGKKAAGGTALASHEVRNLSAQLSDLGVQIAGGGSPFMAMLQQGPQIADVLGGRGLTGIIAGVGQGIASMVNPVTLTLAAITGLGYAASWAFDMIGEEASAANLSIKEQNDLVGETAQLYGAATPAITAFYDELDSRQKAAGKAGGEAALAQIYQPVRVQLPDFEADLASIRLRAEGSGALDSDTRSLTANLQALKEGVDDYTASAERARDIQDTLLRIGEATGNDLFTRFANTEVAGLVDALDKAHNSATPVQNDLKNIESGAAGGAEQLKAMAEGTREVQRALEALNGIAAPGLSEFERASGVYRTAIDGAKTRGDRITADQAFIDYMKRRADQAAGAVVPTPTPRPTPQNGEDAAYEREQAAEKAGRANDRRAASTSRFLAVQHEQLEQSRLEISMIGESEEARRALAAPLSVETRVRRPGLVAEGRELA